MQTQVCRCTVCSDAARDHSGHPAVSVNEHGTFMRASDCPGSITHLLPCEGVAGYMQQFHINVDPGHCRESILQLNNAFPCALGGLYGSFSRPKWAEGSSAQSLSSSIMYCALIDGTGIEVLRQLRSAYKNVHGTKQLCCGHGALRGTKPIGLENVVMTHTQLSVGSWACKLTQPGWSIVWSSA